MISRFDFWCATLFAVVLSLGSVQGSTQDDAHRDYEESRQPATTAYNPVVFIPGFGGSQLEAKLNKTRKVHYLCKTVSDWENIWLNIHMMAPVFFDCLSDNMKLTYDSKTRTTRNTEGVQIRPNNYASVESVAYLDANKVPYTDYFERIIATLERRKGFHRDVDLYGAPYDFRKAPNELGEYFNNLSFIVERAYINSNYKPVTIICHSMGCLNALHFLNAKSTKWKKLYIKRLIGLASPWNGSIKTIMAMIVGDNFGIPILNAAKLQEVQSTFPSLMYLFPRSPNFDKDRVLIETPVGNFTSANLEDLFDTFDKSDQKEMWHDTYPIAKSLSAPGVELWCLHGSNVGTTKKLIFEDMHDFSRRHETFESGDGSIDVRSMSICDNFRKSQDSPVYTKSFANLNHIKMVRDPTIADFIADQIIERDFSA